MLQALGILLLIIFLILSAQMRRNKSKIHPEYTETRNKIFNFSADPHFNDTKKIQLIIIEMDYEGGRVTTAIYPNGRSIHLESGTAPTKYGDREQQPDYVVKAAEHLFEQAQLILPAAKPTNNTSFPAKNGIHFHLLSSEGHFIIQSDIIEVTRLKSPLKSFQDALSFYNKELAAAEHNRQFASGSQYVVIED